MKIVRFLDSASQVRYGVQTSEGRAQLLPGEPWLLEEIKPGEEVAIEKLLAPIVPPTIIAIGLNYKRHAEETKARIPEYPVVFFKSRTSLQNPGDPIELPRHLRSDEVDYECELTIVIGKTGKNIPRENAYDYVFGYTIANDVSARDWQVHRSGKQWGRAKSFDTFCPIGPVIVTEDEIPNPHDLRLRTVVGEEVLQDWNTNDMIFDIPAIIEFLSGSTTLEAGTVILTGTPHGVGMARNPARYLHAGETVCLEIEKIGVLSNPVIEEPAGTL